MQRAKSIVPSQEFTTPAVNSVIVPSDVMQDGRSVESRVSLFLRPQKKQADCTLNKSTILDHVPGNNHTINLKGSKF